MKLTILKPHEYDLEWLDTHPSQYQTVIVKNLLVKCDRTLLEYFPDIDVSVTVMTDYHMAVSICRHNVIQPNNRI